MTTTSNTGSSTANFIDFVGDLLSATIGGLGGGYDAVHRVHTNIYKLQGKRYLLGGTAVAALWNGYWDYAQGGSAGSVASSVLFSLAESLVAFGLTSIALGTIGVFFGVGTLFSGILVVTVTATGIAFTAWAFNQDFINEWKKDLANGIDWALDSTKKIITEAYEGISDAFDELTKDISSAIDDSISIYWRHGQ